MRSTLFLLTTILASALAGPTGLRDSCARHCSLDNVFSYQQGRSYEYDYTVTTTTAVSGNRGNNEALIHITTKAHIDVLDPCEHTLRLSHVTLHGSSHSQEMASALTSNNLRFSFQDGHIEELCAAETEEEWVLNIKRGVLSAFQTSRVTPGKHDIHETDILGTCITHYENQVNGNVVGIKRVKDVNSCSRRADIASYLSSAYTTDSPMQSLPLIDSTSTCWQSIEGGMLMETHCKETHSFAPFSTPQGNAITKVESRLKMVSGNGPAVTPTEQRIVRKTTMFETTKDTTMHTEVEAVTALLTQLGEASHEEVRPQTPALFSRLVSLLRGLNYPVLSQVYAATTDTHNRKFLVDAMPLVGTAAAAAVVRDMFANGDLTKEEVDTWFASLSLLKNPTSDIFTSIAPMLDNNPSQSALLGTSALVNTFCKSNSACGEDSGVQQVMRRMEAQLGSGCRAVNETEKEKILVALRALGNAGRWVNARPVLHRCFTEDNDMEVRVAAIEAWRHTPCEYDRSNLLAAYLDQSQDHEVRIAAYLSVMTCPTPTVLDAVRDRLTSESVNQVGSFVWTHLTNLQESAAPGKEWARVLLGEEMLAYKFNTEALKFSRNYESSFFMNEINIGAAVESNVIFSSKSYLPRSGMLNLTLDLFGESINLFEVGGRIEDFEAYLERMFGPDGYFPEDTVATVLRNLRHQKPDAEATTLEQFLEDVTDEPHGSYYLRMFGNDVHYRRFQGMGSSSQPEPSPFALLMELVRGGNVDYTKSYQLLDTHLSVPTVAGLPLTLGAKGSATLALKMDGSFKAESLADMRIEGHVRPSAAVTVDGVMLVDAHVTQAGAKVSSTLHTSTALDGKVIINGGMLVDIAFNTPKERMEIIDYDTKLFLVQDDDEVEQQWAAPVMGGCSGGFLGMEVCTEVAYESYALVPNSLRKYLRKTDTQTGYTFRFTKSNEEISIVFNNPEARQSRRIAVSVQYDDGKMVVDLDAFFGKAEALGEYFWSSNKKTIRLNAGIGNSKINIDAGVLTSFSDEMRVEPYLKVNMGPLEVVNTKSEIVANPQQNKYLVNFFFSYMFEPIGFKIYYDGSLTTAKTLNLTINSPALETTLDGKLDLEASKMKLEVDGTYYELDRKQHFATILLFGIDHEGDATVYSSMLTITLPFHEKPMVLEHSTEVSPRQLNTEIILTSDDKVLTLKEKWEHTYEDGIRRIKGHASAQCDQIQYSMTGDSEMVFSSDTIFIKNVVNRRMGDEKEIHSYLLDLKHTPGKSLTVLFKTDSFATLNAMAEFMIVEQGFYTAQVNARAHVPEYGEIFHLAAETKLRDNSEPGKFDIKADGTFQCQNINLNLNSEVYGDPQQARVSLQTQHNTDQYGMKMEATKSSFFLDANVIKHFVVNANLDQEGSEKGLELAVEWDKEANPDNVLQIKGKIQPNSAMATFKFLTKEFSGLGRLVSQGVEVESSWSPNQRMNAGFHYSLGDTSFMTATLDTTVPGWEKQSVSIDASLNATEVTCRASGTWRNTQQATFSVVGQLQASGSVHGEVTFTSTVATMERLSLTFDHTMAGAAITSTLQAAWNERQLNGSFKLTPLSTGLQGHALFTSLFTQPFEALLSHQLQDDSLDSSLLVTYGGVEKVKATSKGNLSSSSGDLAMKLTTDLNTLLEAEVTIQYSIEGTELHLTADGKIVEQKMLLNINGAKTVTADSTTTSGDIRFLTPFTRPFTASFSHTHNSQRFTTQFEMTRIWSTYNYGSLKIHAEGHFLSAKDISLSAYISSPETKGSFSFIHKIENNALSTTTNVYANDESISVSINGTVDAASHVLSLSGEVTSSFEGLDIKVSVDSKRQGSAQNTQVDFTHDDKKATLTHTLTITDALNWENTFTFNNHYSLNNKMVHVGDTYQHIMEAKWGEKRFAINSHLTPTFTAETHKLEGHLGLAMPLEHFQKKLDFRVEQNVNGEKAVFVEIEYKPDRKITVTTTTTCNNEGQLLSKGSLLTPFWQPLSYDLNLALQPINMILTLVHGQSTTGRLTGKYQPNSSSFKFNLSTPSLQHPLGIEGFYSAEALITKGSLTVTYFNKYEAKAALSGTVLDGEWELSLREYAFMYQKWMAVHQLDGRWKHELTTMPYKIDASLQLENNLYETSITIDETSFTSNMVLNGNEGSLAARWLLDPNNSNLSIHFQSPFELSKDFDMGVTFDTIAMGGALKLKYDTQEINLLIKMEGQTYVFEGKSPFSGWETLGGSFFISETAINTHVSRNEQKIKVMGTQHLRPAKGKLELVINTPYAGFETISFDASYNFLSENKTIKFKTMYGISEIFAKGVIRVTDPLAPQVTLNVSTPFIDLRTLRASTSWDLNTATKSATTKVVYNEQEFSWRIETVLAGSTKRMTSRVKTPFPGWTKASLEAYITQDEAPYEVRVIVQKEGVTKEFRGRLMLDNNTFSGDVITPIPGLETMSLEGTHTRLHNTFNTAVRVTWNQQIFDVTSDLLFDTYNPKLKIEMTTPLSQANSLKLNVEGNLAGKQKTFNVIFTKNNEIFSAEITSNLKNKIGFFTLRLESPVPGLSTLEVEGSYDLLGDVKKSELDVIKERERQHFAVVATLNNNHVVLDVATPFQGFEVMKLDANYTHSATGKHLLVASFAKDHQTYNFRSDVEMRDTSLVVHLTTPITPIRRVVIDARYQMLRGACQASIRFEKNDDIFELSGKCGFTHEACSLSLEASTPIPSWNKLALNLNYKLESNRLLAEASVQCNNFNKEVSVEATYGAEHGSLVLRTPVPGWQEVGLRYTLSIAGDNEANAQIRVTHNNQEFTFSTHGHYTRESITFSFETPFQGYEELSLEASVNVATKITKAYVKAGPYTFSANGSYGIGDIFLEVTTPFSQLKFGSISIKHTVTSYGLEASLKMVHNENTYFFLGEVTVSPHSSALVFQAQTPIAALPNVTLKFKYNLENINELFTAQLIAGETTYSLIMAANLQEQLVNVKVEMNTPFHGWTQVKLEAKVDLTQEDKALELIVEREGSIKAITIYGKLIGSALNFDLRTPFTGLNRVSISGSLNRVRRSIEFQMMNDAGSASILTNFNSLKLNLKTPFNKVREVSIDIRREGDSYYGTWRRNDNYLTLELVRNPEQRSVTVEIKSEFDGWEFLALTGRLNKDTEEAYASGQIRESKAELTISGRRDDNRSTRNYVLDLKTPYDNYKHVTGELRFSPRKRTIKVVSNSSPFKIDVKVTKRTGLQAEVFVPNPAENTELKVDLKATGGSISFTSRFRVLRSLHYNYQVALGMETEITQKLEINGLEVFTLEFNANVQTQHIHLDIHGSLPGRHTNLHIHREGFSVFNVIFKREVTIGRRTIEKQLSAELTGSGDLPRKGTIHAILTNSFVSNPRTTTIHAEIDRTSTPKKLKLEITFPGKKLYIFDTQYNIDLRNPHQGDFRVRITTPERSAAPWKNFSGNWDVQNPEEATLEFLYGGRKYTAHGKLGLRESNLIATAEGVPGRFFLQWKFIRNGAERDYLFKVGPESSYRLVKLKGTINGIESGDIEGGFKASFQPDEFLFTANWLRSRPGRFNNRGNLSYGRYTGTYNFQLNRDAASRSANFEFNAESNHPQYNQVVISGNYDVLNKLVFKAEAKANNRQTKIDINFSDLNRLQSRNSISANLGFLPPQFRTFQFTLAHDFTNNQNKYITAEATIRQRQSHLRANWKRSDTFDTLEGIVDISSIFIGQVELATEYNVSNLNDAHAKIHYKRVAEGQPEKRVNAIWTRKRTSDQLETELTLDTTFPRLQHVRAYASVDFSQLFNLNAGLDFNNKKITVKLDVGGNAINLEINTPFNGFKNIKTTITYNLDGNNKTVTVHYERGARKGDLELTLNRKSKRKGDLKLNLTTPFEFVRALKIEARWSKRQATVEYLRNDVRVSMTGTAQVDINNSEFNLSFTTPSGRAVTISAAYNVEPFISGTVSSPSKLAALNVDIGETKIKFEISGFRSSERLYVEVHGESTIAGVNTLHLKLDSELNTQNRTGTFELRFNDFTFAVQNHFERYSDGFYVKIKIETSLTPLPALVVGFGKRGAEYIFTLGYGDEKEVTFSIKGKNRFRDGFTGSVDIPNFGYDGVEYDVTYKFPNNNELNAELKAKLGAREHLEAALEYKSDGVKARLSSPFTGRHSARMRRSVTTDSFFSEIGFDDYSLKLRGGFQEGDVKRGVVLEADILGREFFFDYLLQSEGLRYTEGKLLLQTPFRGWERMGGVFTFSTTNLRVLGHSEVFIPFFLNIPRVTAEVNLDLSDRIDGWAALNVAGEEFKVGGRLQGPSLQDGLSGTVWLITPFHSLPEVEMTGSVKLLSPNTFEADLKLTYSFTSHDIYFSYDLSTTNKKVEIRINENSLKAEYKMDDSNFTMNVDTRWANVERKLSVNTRYSLLEDLEGSVTIMVGEQTHKVQGILSIISSRVRGQVNLESSFFGGVRKLEFNTTMPETNLGHVSFSMMLTATQVHSFSFNLDIHKGVAATSKVNTPAFPSTTISLQLAMPRAALTITTPEATHTAAVSWRQARRMPADHIMNAELDTPLLSQRYALSLVMGGSRSMAMVKAELQEGSVTHTLEANTFIRTHAGGFTAIIQTPFRNIQKVALSGLLDISEGVKVEGMASMADVRNAFIFVYDTSKGTIMAEAGSPYIPTGLFKATAQVSKEQHNTNLQMAVMNAREVISGRFDLEAPNNKDITVRAALSTPIEGLKTVNAVLKYQRNEVTQMLFSLDHPITFRAEMKFSNMDKKFIGNVTAKTSITTFEYLEADIEIPFTKFAPSVSLTLPTGKYGFDANYSMEGHSKKATATIFLNDQSHGGSLSFRTQAPYELAYKYHILDCNNAFHLRTDSSFFTVLM